CCNRVNLLLQTSNGRFLFLEPSMCFEELIEQHRVHSLVADGISGRTSQKVCEFFRNVCGFHCSRVSKLFYGIRGTMFSENLRTARTLSAPTPVLLAYKRRLTSCTILSIVSSLRPSLRSFAFALARPFASSIPGKYPHP